MPDEKKTRDHLRRLGPLIFIITLVIVIEFFWWFMHG